MMHVRDTTVDVSKWTMVFYIVDSARGYIWSRNRWGYAGAIPDMYLTSKAACKQATSGKASRSGTPIVRKMVLGYDVT